MKAERAQRSTNRTIARDVVSVRKHCSTLLGFVREAWPLVEHDRPFVQGWHIEFICRHLEAITNGTLLAMGCENRLLANVPPSFTKSLVVSVFWPAWEWGPARKPSMQYIATSFRQDFCLRDSRRMRDLVMSGWYQQSFPHVELVATGEWRFSNTQGGFREAVPFGSLTGGKADRILIDDPHSVDTAESDADRERAVMRFRESVTTRLNDPVRSAIVVIMQRLHERDIAGEILRLDLAASEDKGAAYTCGVLLGRHYYVGNVVREHVGNWRFRKARGRTSVGRLQSAPRKAQARRLARIAVLGHYMGRGGPFCAAPWMTPEA
ncbi:MAG TPA: hypothetical protein VF913_01135 [Xanthobacteraceae bacterium]